MRERTARLNALRGLLRELGVFIPMGAREVVPFVWSLVEDADSDLPEALRPIFAEACREIREIEALPANTRAGSSAIWVASPSGETATCAPSSSTERARCSSTPGSSNRTASRSAAVRKERDGETGRTGAGKAENNCGP